MEHLSTLVIMAKTGDREAYGKLYSLIYTDLYKMALFTLGNSDDAQDAVSEAFVDGFKGISKLKEPDAFKSWMFKILYAKCNRIIKSYIRGRNHINYDQLLEQTGFEPSVTPEYEQNLDLLKALSGISPEERTIIIMFTVLGYKIVEISKILGKPQGTISSKIHRTLKKLKSDLS